MIDILLITISILLSVNAQTDTTSCVNNIIKWCENKDYSNIGQSSSVSSTSVNGSYQSVRCLSNSSGTNCSKNGYPWLECSPDHKVTYKGTMLRKNSATGADNEICFTSTFVSNNGYQASAQISKMKKEQAEIFKDCFPFCDNNPFGN